MKITSLQQLLALVALGGSGVGPWHGSRSFIGVKADDEIIDSNVSYVIEPFEEIEETSWFFSDPTIAYISSAASSYLFGNGALQVDILETNESSFEVGWVSERRPHNCQGASQFSIWIKTATTMSMEVSILDDRDCLVSNQLLSEIEQVPCNDPQRLSIMRLFPQQELQESLDWHHLSIGVDQLEGIDLRRIRGWKIQLVNATGPVFLDHLACEGGGSLLGAAFHTTTNSSSIEQVVEDGTWMETFYESEIATNMSSNYLEGGILQMDYVVEQVQTWGGFNDVAHLAPGNAYYNLSQASGLVLDYNVLQAASISERCIFRFVLQDGSHCETDCGSDYHQQERWYSFHSIMDMEGPGRLTLPLEGSTKATSAFWYTGWSGISGNLVFDPAHIKGFTIEVVLDSGLEVGTSLSGSVSFYNMTAVVLPEGWEGSCVGVVEENLYFHEWAGQQFTRIEFLSAQCCEICDQDPECLYALSNGRDCFVASYVDPNYVGLLANEITSTFKSYWMDDADKRGDWCDKCNCQELYWTIDCRGQDLIILPKTINVSWQPRIIDLQENPRLVVIGTGVLEEVGNALEEIRLPQNVKYLAPGSLEMLPKLKNLVFEGDGQGNEHYLINSITSDSGIFGDVCCGLGATVQVNGDSSIIGCDMKIDTPGIDSTYDPFFNYFDATTVQAISESSTFMSEAAESVEKCAEYCTLDNDCNFFTYDHRLPNADHRCLMFENNGTIYEFVCCTADNYADEEGTIPGTISGKTPQTRNREDNARVIYSTTNLELTEANQYSTELTISLGSNPLRGAVWVNPKVISEAARIDVDVWPARVPLYTSNSTGQVYVSLPKAPAAGSNSMTVILQMDIMACDEAFTIKENSEDGLIYLSVMPMDESDESNLALAIGIPLALAVLLLVAVFVWYEQNRKQNDMIWKVKREELRFADPPKVIGRGTFGLVLLAEYRGTEVAVKRVIPAKSKRSGNAGLSSVSGENSIAGAMSLKNQKDFTSQRTTSDDFDGMESTASGQPSGLKSGSALHDFSGTSSGHKAGKTSWGAASFGFGSKGMMSSPVTSSNAVGLKKLLESGDRATWKKLRNDFVEEMRYLSKLRHPCICCVMGAVIGDREEPMLVMEYMDHGSLYDWLKNDTMIIEGEVLLPILRDISQGVRFLHSADPQVIHGDLKAANILVDSKFRAKVADFGLSQKKQTGGTGTPYWMAPELLRKESSNTAASDVFSFGVILIEMYSRKDPYEGEEPKDVLTQVADKAIQKRPAIPESCPSQIRSLISDCLVDEAENRPTFEEIDTRLKRIDSEAIDVTGKDGEARNIAVSLFDIFPRHIAEALRDGRQVEAEHRDCVTIFFSDIVDFTAISSKLPPGKVADLLDRLYSKFDTLSTAHDIFKVETIGDAYMAVTNLVKDQPNDHAKRIADFSIEAILAANDTLIDEEDESKGFVNIRCGFHSGPVVADVVGNRSPRYCLFGDAVNSAHRMESNSKCNRIHCSGVSADLLKQQYPELPLNSRGLISIKGKGEMHTYWVNEKGRRITFLNRPGMRSSGMEQALANVVENGPTESEEFSMATPAKREDVEAPLDAAAA